jgi:hypothetical protein
MATSSSLTVSTEVNPRFNSSETCALGSRTLTANTCWSTLRKVSGRHVISLHPQGKFLVQGKEEALFSREHFSDCLWGTRWGWGEASAADYYLMPDDALFVLVPGSRVYCLVDSSTLRGQVQQLNSVPRQGDRVHIMHQVFSAARQLSPPSLS